MNPAVNLRELAIDRSKAVAGRPRRTVSRLLVPLGVLVAFIGTVLWSFRESFVAAVPVTVVPVLAVRSEFQAVDTPLFRAAGWIEPRPTPVVVTSLIEGVVEKLRVIEGQEVEAGSPVADLIRADAEIGVRQAKAEVLLQKSGLGSAQARLDAAETYFQEPIERISLVAAADSDLAKTETELNRVPALMDAAKARLDQTMKEFESKSKAGSAVSAISVAKAESELAIARANVAELEAQKESLTRERAALATRRDTLRRQLELKIEEKRQVEEARAEIEAAKAQVELAESKLAAAELELSRTTIVAPITGKVLSLVARPGSKLMGFAPGALQDASTVITMYDPEALQIRADVRLENVPQVLQGQKVEVSTPAVGGTVFGHVLAITSTTDIQKNTLQVKVALDEPPPVLKPDMLVEAVFLAPPVATSQNVTPPLRLMIPKELIDTAAAEPMVWIADRQSRTARRRLVTVGSASQGGLVEVTAGLNVGDRVIASGRELMQDGLKIEIRSEQADGSSMPASDSKSDSQPNRL